MNIVVAGGTSGMGKGIAMHYLHEGGRVTVIGSTSERGQRFLEEAEAIGAAERAFFIKADLMKAEGNRLAIKRVMELYDSLDALILTAIKPFPKRVVTADGYEGTFSLYYVSRFILSYGLSPLLERGRNPLIISLGGTGMTKGEINWNNLTLDGEYRMIKAMLQAGRANDLLGVAYAENNKTGKTKFILNHPGYTNSGFNHIKEPTKTIFRLLGKFFAQPVEKSIKAVIELMNNPPEQSLIPWDRNKPLDLSLSSLDKGNALRLYELTKNLLEIR